MPDPFTMSLIGGGVTALAEYFFGADPESMSPEQRRALEYVWAELKKGSGGLGFSAQEKGDMRTDLRTNVMDFAEKQTGRALASNARRGPTSPGQTAGITTDILSGAGEAFGQGITDINLASASAGRQREGQLLGMLPGLSQGIPDQGGGTGIGDYMSQLAYYFASKKKKPNYNQPTIGQLSNNPAWSWQGNP